MFHIICTISLLKLMFVASKLNIFISLYSLKNETIISHLLLASSQWCQFTNPSDIITAALLKGLFKHFLQVIKLLTIVGTLQSYLDSKLGHYSG